MNSSFRRFFAVLLFLVLVGVMPAEGAGAEATPQDNTTMETSAEVGNETSDGQEMIEEEEVPLASPGVNTTMFMWCGIAMVVVLATITGCASFQKEEIKR